MKTDKKLCGFLTAGKGSSWSCGVQDHPLISVSHKMHLPKKDENKFQWLKVLSVPRLIIPIIRHSPVISLY